MPKKCKPDKYTCAKCGKTFDKGWSDEEAEAEYDERFADEKAANEPRDLVCDDCYNIIVGPWPESSEGWTMGQKIETVLGWVAAFIFVVLILGFVIVNHAPCFMYEEVTGTPCVQPAQ